MRFMRYMCVLFLWGSVVHTPQAEACFGTILKTRMRTWYHNHSYVCWGFLVYAGIGVCMHIYSMRKRSPVVVQKQPPVYQQPVSLGIDQYYDELAKRVSAITKEAMDEALLMREKNNSYAQEMATTRT